MFSTKDSLETNIGPSDFLNGIKYKFGMYLLVACDHVLYFIDICLCHPGSTSNYLAFNVSLLYKRFEDEGVIVPGYAACMVIMLS